MEGNGFLSIQAACESGTAILLPSQCSPIMKAPCASQGHNALEVPPQAALTPTSGAHGPLLLAPNIVSSCNRVPSHDCILGGMETSIGRHLTDQLACHSMVVEIARVRHLVFLGCIHGTISVCDGVIAVILSGH